MKIYNAENVYQTARDKLLEALKKKTTNEIEEGLEEFKEILKRRRPLQEDNDLLSFATTQVELVKMRDR